MGEFLYQPDRTLTLPAGAVGVIDGPDAGNHEWYTLLVTVAVPVRAADLAPDTEEPDDSDVAAARPTQARVTVPIVARSDDGNVCGVLVRGAPVRVVDHDGDAPGGVYTVETDVTVRGHVDARGHGLVFTDGEA